MHASSTVPLRRGDTRSDEPRIWPTSRPRLGGGDSAEVTLRLVQERDRIAGGMNDIVVYRLFPRGSLSKRHWE